MASTKFFMLTVAVMFLPAMALATDFIVGDDIGWTVGVDYQAWAMDKVFHVGDKLVFQYPKGYHNVFKVNGTAFQNCDIPPPNEALTSGYDTIVLQTPGNKWYICGFSGHCAAGQKLKITVQYPYGWAPATAPSSPRAPSPEPSSVPATPTEPWAPTPAPWAPVPSSPSALAPTEPWSPPSPSPYPWI